MNLPNPFPLIPDTNVFRQNAQISMPHEEKSFCPAGKNGVILAVVLDESGSMGYITKDTIIGFNSFLENQKNQPGLGYVTLVKFASPDIKVVYKNLELEKAADLTTKTYAPGGGTNLMDAIGDTLYMVNDFLLKSPLEERPGVIVTIITDGEENASHKYNNKQIKELVKLAENSDWTFTFLGANIDAFAVGSSFGMNMNNSTSYSVGNMKDTMDVVTASTSRMRVAKMSGVTTFDLYSNSLYSAEERDSMLGVGENKK